MATRKAPTKLYYLHPSKKYYNDEWHYYRAIGDFFPKGLYKRAFSRKQVYNYMIRDIAAADKTYFGNIYIDIYDIEELENEK